MKVYKTTTDGSSMICHYVYIQKQVHAECGGVLTLIQSANKGRGSLCRGEESGCNVDTKQWECVTFFTESSYLYGGRVNQPAHRRRHASKSAMAIGALQGGP